MKVDSLKTFLESFLYLFGYPTCHICSKEIIYTDKPLIKGLCIDCYLKVKSKYENFNRCLICSSPLQNGVCNKFHHKNIEKIYSIFPLYPEIYQKYLDAKYRKDSVLKNTFCKLFEFYFNKEIENEFWKPIDLITYVPISLYKKIIRKYNPSYLFAKIVSRKLSKPLKSLFVESGFKYFHIERGKKDILFSERFKIINKSKIKNKSILIVDDIYTTGKTVSFLSDLLIFEGASKIFVLTLFNH